MTLSFSTQMGGKPTHFVEKIWTAFNLGEGEYQLDFVVRGWWIEKCDWSKAIDRNLLAEVGIKIHTIRADQKNRWRVGMPIHFVIHNRTPNRFQFAPILPVKAIQKIKISYTNSNSDYPDVYIDGKRFNVFVKGDMDVLGRLAANDGFESVDDFFRYFSSDFEGIIIHWTDYIYSF
jgi:hypothetical protein